jgi:hypothetical protein
MNDRTASKALGWAGIGIGLVELAAPGWLGRRLGLGADGAKVLRALGVREVLSGLGTVVPPDPGPGLWSRLAGNVMDLAALGVAVRKSERRGMVVGALVAVAAIGALDAVVAWRQRRA